SWTLPPPCTAGIISVPPSAAAAVSSLIFLSLISLSSQSVQRVQPGLQTVERGRVVSADRHRFGGDQHADLDRAEDEAVAEPRLVLILDRHVVAGARGDAD